MQVYKQTGNTRKNNEYLFDVEKLREEVSGKI
jgi:hypothetical protein